MRRPNTEQLFDYFMIMKNLFIDISDLLIYATNNRRITGIQRVEISFLQFMIENRLQYTLVNSCGIKSSHLDYIIRDRIGSPDDLLRELRLECAHVAPQRIVDKLKHFYEKVAVGFDPSRIDLSNLGAGDTLFVPGAYWLNVGIMRFYRAAAAKGVKLVVLLHDVLPITHPHLMIENSDRFFGPILKLPIHVITGSRATAAELPRATQLVEGAQMPLSIDVVSFAHEFPGVRRNQPAGRVSERLKRMIRERPFVLYVSTVEVRKNHLRLIEVWNKLAKQLGDRLPLLLIAGKRGWEAKQAISLLDAANEREARFARGTEPVLFVEGPSDGELQWLYAACDFTVFPSLAEGWGLPVGESLWFGKACAASRTTSIPEVGQDLCVYFDPSRVEEIEAAVRTLLDPILRASYESKIRAAGLRTWHDAARDLARAVRTHVSDSAVVCEAAAPACPTRTSFRQPDSFAS
jgi:glycosyltransferase involved in cell wall biosynthesis